MSVYWNEWVTWLYTYLAVGLMTDLIFYGFSLKDRPTQFVKDMRSALGLGKISKSVVVENTPQIAGMVNKVNHLVKVEEA